MSYIFVNIECKKGESELEELDEVEYREGYIKESEIVGFYKDSKGGTFIQLTSNEEIRVRETIEEIRSLIEIKALMG